MENEGQQTKKQVILGWAPPANVYMPSPAMSVLKAYLQNFGYNVCIEYWNLYLRKLQNEFMWSDGTLADEGAEHLLLYYNYLAIKHKDTCAYNRLKVLLKATNLSISICLLIFGMNICIDMPKSSKNC